VTRRQLLQRVTEVDQTGGERWRKRPVLSDLRWEVLTAAECETAAQTRAHLDAVGLPGLSDAELDFMICLNERLAGERDAPCVSEATSDA
jgi:hypothetical protein